MSLEVSPLELDFRRPFTQEVSQIISLGNRNDSPVAFKVKTTAPKRYCVRPNSGRIEPGTAVEVQVLLQAMKEDPPLDQKCRDKFLVQSVLVPADKEFSNVTAIWQDADANRDTMKPFERKIKVAFLPPLDAAAATDEGATNTSSQQNTQHQKPTDDPPAYSSFPTTSNYSTPAAARIASANSPPSQQQQFKSQTQTQTPAAEEQRPESAKRSSSDSRSPRTSVDGPAPAVVASAVANSTSDTSDAATLKKQLQEAQVQIERLRDQLADQGLRRRIPASETGEKGASNGDIINGGDAREKADGEGKMSGAGMGGLGDGAAALLQASGEQGVALNMVAVLCFISFLLGYLFF